MLRVLKVIGEQNATAELLIRRERTCVLYMHRLTAADVVVGYCVMWASVVKGGRIIYDYPNVKSYLARLKARPKFADTMGTARDWVISRSEYKRGQTTD